MQFIKAFKISMNKQTADNQQTDSINNEIDSNPHCTKWLRKNWNFNYIFNAMQGNWKSFEID